MDDLILRLQREALYCPLAAARLSAYYDRAGIPHKPNWWKVWEEHYDEVFWHAKKRFRVSFPWCYCCTVLHPSLYKAHNIKFGTSKFMRGKHKSLRSHRDGSGSKEWRRWRNKQDRK